MSAHKESIEAQNAVDGARDALGNMPPGPAKEAARRRLIKAESHAREREAEREELERAMEEDPMAARETVEAAFYRAIDPDEISSRNIELDSAVSELEDAKRELVEMPEGPAKLMSMSLTLTLRTLTLTLTLTLKVLPSSWRRGNMMLLK